MSKFYAFAQYMTMHELGQLDAIARNYALDCDYSKKPLNYTIKGDFVRLGLHRLGYPSGDACFEGLGVLMSHLHNHKYYPSMDLVARRVAEWYTYDRLATKEIRRWPLRSKTTDPLDLARSL